MQTLMNRRRLQQACAARGVDALVLCEPINIYHATGFYPNTVAMGQIGTSVAIVPADPAVPVRFVLPLFVYYFFDLGRAAPHAEIEAFLYTAPVGEDAAPPSYYAEADDGEEDGFERATRAATDAVLLDRKPSATVERALAEAMSDLAPAAKVAVDGFAGVALIGGMRAWTPAEPILREVRMIKSPREIELMRHAASSNEQAAREAIAAMVIGQTYADLEAAFFAAVGLRGGTPFFLAIDSRSYAGRDGTIREGRCFQIDAVSRFAHYHGDFGRTVVVGEPHPELLRATEAARQANEAIARLLAPGLRYSDVMKLGRKVVAEQGIKAFTPASPHSVGLFHTDEAFEKGAQTFAKADHLIEPGMVLSVDLPILMTDMNGTVHLEDLWLITETGCEPLNDISEPVIQLQG